MSPLHSRGSPTKGNKIRIGCLTSAFSGAHKWAEMLRHPFILGDSQTRGQNQKWLPDPCLLGAHKWAEMLCHPCNSRGSPNKGTKITICCLTPAFSGAQNWAEMLRHPCILGGPHKGGQTWPMSSQCQKAP